MRNMHYLEYKEEHYCDVLSVGYKQKKKFEITLLST